MELELLADRARAVRSDGTGRLVLIAGEAGIGKSALLRAFADGHPDTRVLSGACDALHTPRPLGPLLDIAEDAGGEFAALASDGATPAAIVAALTRETRRKKPTVVVLEDLHWADGATLDVLRLLVRRLNTVPALVLATYRNDELDRSHPLRITLGELPRGPVDRITLRPLSLGAVHALARDADTIDPADLHRHTAGNPFYVTEVLATGGDTPETVRDAVLARAGRLDDRARALLDAVAIVPQKADLALLEALAGRDLDQLDKCLASGMLRTDRDAVGFRHEIARVAVEEALAPHRRLQLHRIALSALAAGHGGRIDPARLAHHAEAANDREAVLRYAPVAAERAAKLGSHREAAGQFARAIRHAQDLPPNERAELLERRSYECYLTDCIEHAVEARRLALVEHRAAHDRRREADTHRWLSRLAWFSGDNRTAEREAAIAVELLEPLAPGRELAMAYSNVAQLRMLASDFAGAKAWGEQAIALAEQLGETATLVHALNNVGSAALIGGDAAGRPMLERSLALALDAGLEEHVARGYTNLGAVLVEAHEHTAGDAYLEAGLAYCTERDLDSWFTYMQGYQARSQLDQGRFDAAAEIAGAVLSHCDMRAPTRITPLIVIGRLRARRGDPDPWAPLDEALGMARGTGELQRLAVVAAARAEAYWIAGEPERIEAETGPVLARALLQDHDAWSIGELCVWRRRAGLTDDVPSGAIAEPYRLELEGHWQRAAARWTELGCPYEAALALAGSGRESAQRRAFAALQELRARPVASRIARALRERGVRDLSHGPRAATRGNPAGMTARELEVLMLVAEGLRNADIAARLFLSQKTVAHHVSAILRKLDVASRSQAGAAAARLGIVER